MATDFENTQIIPEPLGGDGRFGGRIAGESSTQGGGFSDPGQPIAQPQPQAVIPSQVLPPNTNGRSIENTIDAATLGRFNPQGQGGPSAEDIAFVRGQVDPLSGEPAALDDATNELFMPGINKSIRVGGTTGQLTGSRDIFVAQGGLTPFAAMERKKAAQQAAAAERAKKLNQFKRKDPKLAKDPRFNDNVLKQNAEHDEKFIERAKKEYGAAWQVALMSPQTAIGREYLQGKDNLDLLVDKADQVTDLVGEVNQAIEKGDQYVSDATLELKRQYDELTDEFSQERGNIGQSSMRNIVDKLQTSADLDQFIKDKNILANVDAVILQTAGVDDSRSDQFRSTTRYTENFDIAARAAAKELKNNASFRGRTDLTEDDVFQYIKNLKGKTDKRTASVTGRTESGGYTSKDQVPVSEKPKIIKVGNSEFKTEKSVPYSQKVQKTPVRLDGAIVLGEDGQPVIQSGIINFTPVENSILTTKDGVKRRVVRGKQIIDVSTLSDDEKRDLGIGRRSKQTTIEKDVTLDFDNVEASIKGLSKDAGMSVDAFNDVSKDQKRQSVNVSADNFESDFKAAYEESGFKTPEEFVKAAAEQGVDIIFNEDTKKKAQGIHDPLRQ